MSFGAWIKEKRVAAGVAQGDIARELGYTTGQYISNFERDKCYPAKNVVRTLAKMYGIPEREIINEILKHQKRELEDKWLSA